MISIVRFGSTQTYRDLKCQRVAHLRRPLCDINTVRTKEGQSQPVHAKSDAACMRDPASMIAQSPGLAKMIAMIIEAQASCRGISGPDGNKQFEFQRLLNLAHRHHLARATKKWIARRHDGVG